MGFCFVFFISGEFTEQLEIFITVRKHCWSEVRLIWPVSEVAVSLGVLARPVARRTGTERRAACFGICARLRVPAAVKADWLARGEKKKNPAVSGFISVISAQRAPRHEPLAACKAARTDTCLRIHRSQQPSQSETELSSAGRRPGDGRAEGEPAGAQNSTEKEPETRRNMKTTTQGTKLTPRARRPRDLGMTPGEVQAVISSQLLSSLNKLSSAGDLASPPSPPHSSV